MTQKIDSSNLDAIIIGAGPAGGSAARELARCGKKVLLIEHSQEIGEPNYSTAGTPKETIEEFELPQEIIASPWKKILIATPRLIAKWEFPETMGYVLDFAKLRKFLAEDAARHGAEILVGTNVEDFIWQSNKIVGVRYHGSLGDGEAYSKIIIDATGHNEFANSKLNINSSSLNDLGTAMEYVMTNFPSELYDTLALYLGPDFIVPGVYGYAWCFPMNNNQDAKIGICALGPLPPNIKLEDLQERFIKMYPYFKNMEPVEIHGGTAMLADGKQNHVHKNIILVGDAARQVNPLGGEGIRHALSAGRLAADIAGKSLDEDIIDEEALKNTYEKAWRKKYGWKWKQSYLFDKACAKLDGHQWDIIIKNLQRMPPDDAYEFIFHYDFKKIMKYMTISILPFIKTLFEKND